MATGKQPITNLLATNAEISGAVAISGALAITGDVTVGPVGSEKPLLTYVSDTVTTVITGANGLIGPAGPPGQDGTNGTNGTNGTDGAVLSAGATGPAGANGLSAYELADAAGLPAEITTEELWIASLSGAAGGLAIMLSPAGWNTFDYFPANPTSPAAPVGDGMSWTVYIDVNAGGTRMYIWKPHPVTNPATGVSSGGGWNYISTVELIDPNTDQPAGATTVLTAI
jgi:hypothetical protein